MATAAPESFASLLNRAVNAPGIISSAYSAFHDYSFGNQLLAWSQCQHRGIPVGPLATFNKWKELGRHVRKGEKALTLCRPIIVKRKAESDADAPAVFTRFVFQSSWFVLAQTDGAPVEEPPTPTWDKDRALAWLNITEVPFDVMDGNALGLARGRSIAINPVNPFPWKTRFHELAHILLGHTSDDAKPRDDESISRELREVEAESVALVCCAALRLPGEQFARGYIQTWSRSGVVISEKTAQRVFKAADAILKAGVPRTTERMVPCVALEPADAGQSSGTGTVQARRTPPSRSRRTIPNEGRRAYRTESHTGS